MSEEELLNDRFGGLIFDCDGTLVDNMPTHFEAWTRTLARHGIAFSQERFYALAGVPTRDIVQLLADEAGLDVDAGAVAAQRDALFDEIEGELSLIEPVVAIARRHRGVLPMAVASGSTRAHVERSLVAFGIRDWFGAIVGAEDVRRAKPAPDAFLEAARRLGVEPARCRAYEDSDAGLEAIRRANMSAVDIRPWLVRR